MGSNIGTTRCNGRHLHHISHWRCISGFFDLPAQRYQYRTIRRCTFYMAPPAKEAAALGIGINKAYEIVNDGTINSKRIGRRILIPKLYLVDYIQQTRYNKGV